MGLFWAGCYGLNEWQLHKLSSIPQVFCAEGIEAVVGGCFQRTINRVCVLLHAACAKTYFNRVQNMLKPKVEFPQHNRSAAKCYLSLFWHLLTGSCGLTRCHCFVPFLVCYLCTKRVLPTTLPWQGGNRNLLAVLGKPHDHSSIRKSSNTTPALLCLWQAAHHRQRAHFAE